MKDFSPMHNEATGEDLAIINYLLKNGADPAIWDALQGHPLLVANWYHEDPAPLLPFKFLVSVTAIIISNTTRSSQSNTRNRFSASNSTSDTTMISGLLD